MVMCASDGRARGCGGGARGRSSIGSCNAAGGRTDGWTDEGSGGGGHVKDGRRGGCWGAGYGPRDASLSCDMMLVFFSINERDERLMKRCEKKDKYTFYSQKIDKRFKKYM